MLVKVFRWIQRGQGNIVIGMRVPAGPACIGIHQWIIVIIESRTALNKQFSVIDIRLAVIEPQVMPDFMRNNQRQIGIADSQVAVAIDARRNKDMPSGFELVVSGGTKPVGKDAISWARECNRLGAGIILPTSMDGDGTQSGYDLEFTKAVSKVVSVPVIASGGVGTLEHFYEGVVKGGAEILLAASVFHFRILSIKDVKEFLREKGLDVNL